MSGDQLLKNTNSLYNAFVGHMRTVNIGEALSFNSDSLLFIACHKKLTESADDLGYLHTLNNSPTDLDFDEKKLINMLKSKLQGLIENNSLLASTNADFFLLEWINAYKKAVGLGSLILLVFIGSLQNIIIAPSKD